MRRLIHPATAPCLFLAVCLAACSAKQDRLIGSVSDPSEELMSHDFRYAGTYDGWHYGLYNASCNTTKEHPKNLDIDLRLSRWKTGDIKHRLIRRIWVTGQGITDHFRPPYDPTGIIEGSTLHILFCPGVNGRSAYVHVPYDLDREALGPEEVMTLDGREITVGNVLDNFKARTGAEIPWFSDGGGETAYGIGMNVGIVRHGGYFYSVISANAHGFTAMIVRSKDLVHWETAAVADLSSVPVGISYWEGAVYPLHDDIFAFTIRIQSENGVIYGTWNATTGALADLRCIEGSITARPEFFSYRGSTYLFCNTFGPSEVEGYGSVYRATGSFYKISPDGATLQPVRTKSVPEGIHYPTFYTEPGCRLFPRCHLGERLYILYSTDARRLDPFEARSNIALERLVLRDPSTK